jgi:hypothetical protein
MSADTSTTFRKELLTLEEQKGQIEKALTWYLSRGSDLTDRQKYLLRNALGHTYRGLFPIAAGYPQSGLGGERLVSVGSSHRGDGYDVTHQVLCRSLAYLSGTPAQYPPVFR